MLVGRPLRVGPTAASAPAVEAAVAGLVGRRAVVLVSQDTEQMQRLCDRVIDLDREPDSVIPQGDGEAADSGHSITETKGPLPDQDRAIMTGTEQEPAVRGDHSQTARMSDRCGLVGMCHSRWER